MANGGNWMSLFDAGNQTINSILKHTPNAVYILNLQKHVIYWNPSAEKLFGWTEEEVLDKPLPIVPKDKQREFMELFEFVTKGNSITNRETIRQKKDGTRIDVSLSTAPYYRDDQIDGFAVIARDITQIKNDQRYLVDVIKELSDIKYALDSATLFTIADVEGNITEANDKFCEITKYQRHELIGKNHRIINSKYHPPSFFVELWQTIQSGKIWTGEVRNRAKDGTIFWADTIIVPFMNEDGEPFQYMTIRTDITARKNMEEEMKQAQEKLRYAAYHDYLTGIPNRRSLVEVLQKEMDRTLANSSLLGVICLNIDSFKFINDTIGHDQGDMLLTVIAKTLTEHIGSSGFVARLAGDEFAIVLPNILDMDTIHEYTDGLFALFQTPFMISSYEFLLTISMGIAVYPYEVESPNELLKNASLALYRAKDEGRSRYKIYSHSMDNKTYKMFSLQNDIIKAVESNQFQLHYQPKVDQSGNLLGCEALLRWNHPKWGMVPPIEFIELAEKSGNIIPVSNWVLERVCQQINEWDRLGLPPIRVAINVSALHYLHSSFIDQIKLMLNQYQISPEYLEVEITESAVLTNEQESIRKINELKQIGIQIALDDFGTGYSSLLYLKKFKVNTVKIDRSFIHDIEEDEESTEIISTIIHLSKKLRLRTVAEGVETKKQFQMLKNMECDEMQGYLFSKPIPPEQFADILKRGSCAVSTK